jgi:hypothetical protein
MALVKCGSCGNEVSPDAAACPKCGKPLKKRMGIVKILLLAMGGLFLLCVIGGVLSGGKRDKGVTSSATPRPSTPSAGAQAAVPGEAVAAPPAQPPAAPAEPAFVTLRKAACDRYKGAPNDIKKSTVFSEYEAAAKAKKGSLDGIIGTVKSIETPQGGAEVWVKIETPFGVLKNMEGPFGSGAYDIKKGTAIYKAAGELAEGQQVKVTATAILPEKVLTEESLVCDDTWLAKFTAIVPVK